MPPEKPEIWEFSNVTLAEASSHVAAASGLEIIVAPEVAMLRVSGKFKVGEGDAFLRIIPRTLPVRVDADGAKRFRIRSK